MLPVSVQKGRGAGGGCLTLASGVESLRSGLVRAGRKERAVRGWAKASRQAVEWVKARGRTCKAKARRRQVNIRASMPDRPSQSGTIRLPGKPFVRQCSGIGDYLTYRGVGCPVDKLCRV